MIRLYELKLPVDVREDSVVTAALKRLHLPMEALRSFKIRRRSLDARKRPALSFVYTVDLFLRNEDIRLPANSERLPDDHGQYRFPEPGSGILSERPAILGAGPAGLFAALLLARNGYRPLILERGGPVDERVKSVEAFWEGEAFDGQNNVHFGEGGAGTFSDGKLSSGNKDLNGRISFVLSELIRFGASPEIAYEQLPHVGSDALRGILLRLRKEIESLGGSYTFYCHVTDLEISAGRLSALLCADGRRIPCSVCIFAPGHAAFDSFQMLDRAAVPMEEKPFAIGFRIEHPQEMIDLARYGKTDQMLGPASYKLTRKADNGRAVYSFCMCPGGYVVNAAADRHDLSVNGMSYAKRDSGIANAAIVAAVTPDDFKAYCEPGIADALQGFSFQKHFGRLTHALADGAIPQQLWADYEKRQSSTAYGHFSSATKGRRTFAALDRVLPAAVDRAIRESIPAFSRQIRGFDRADAVLSGTELRTSSPVRVLRDGNGESAVKGLYPCGEGCGYAGGIISAAVDGMRCAEWLAKAYAPLVRSVYIPPEMC